MIDIAIYVGCFLFGVAVRDFAARKWPDETTLARALVKKYGADAETRLKELMGEEQKS